MAIGIRKLLSRGDEVCIERGRLVIRSASGKPVPPDWLQAHSPSLIREILTAIGIDAYEYCGHTTGRYGRGKWSGLTLQFSSSVTHTDAHVFFNVGLTRSRSTKAGKAGTPLPEGHFRVGENYNFCRFWEATGLAMPKRLSSFHDYMGNLRGILFTADITKGHENRLIAKSIRPLSVSADEVYKAFQPDNCQTTARQAPDNSQTRVPDKDSAPALDPRGFQPEPPTCDEYYVNKLTSKHVNTCAGYPALSRKRPEEQDYDEWLDEYSSQSDHEPDHGNGNHNLPTSDGKLFRINPVATRCDKANLSPNPAPAIAGAVATPPKFGGGGCDRCRTVGHGSSRRRGAGSCWRPPNLGG